MSERGCYDNEVVVGRGGGHGGGGHGGSHGGRGGGHGGGHADRGDRGHGEREWGWGWGGGWGPSYYEGDWWPYEDEAEVEIIGRGGHGGGHGGHGHGGHGHGHHGRGRGRFFGGWGGWWPYYYDWGWPYVYAYGWPYEDVVLSHPYGHYLVNPRQVHYLLGAEVGRGGGARGYWHHR